MSSLNAVCSLYALCRVTLTSVALLLCAAVAARPYPCHPGTYCTKGVGYDKVKSLDFKYAQNCTAGFFCEAASTSRPSGVG